MPGRQLQCEDRLVDAASLQLGPCWCQAPCTHHLLGWQWLDLPLLAQQQVAKLHQCSMCLMQLRSCPRL